MGETRSPLTRAPECLDARDDHSAASGLERVARLSQCPCCAFPLETPITLPCGRCLCRNCLPQPRLRANISYPSNPSRLQGFDCPFDDCGVEHALDDCALDVTLSRVLLSIRQALASQLGAQDSSAVLIGGSFDTTEQLTQPLAEPALTIDSVSECSGSSEAGYHGGGGGPGGDLPQDTAAHNANPSVLTAEDAGPRISRGHCVTDLDRVAEAVRPEVDCQVCYALYLDAVTTRCGHTFCRHCLQRILDHSDICAVCRRSVHRGTWQTNRLLSKILAVLWPGAVESRRLDVVAEESNGTAEFDTPLFVCTLSFPAMPTFLHVFEPRYRLMIRRCLEHDRTFGMVLHRRARRTSEPDFVELGTLLRIINVEFFPDGRSLLETVGVSRFRVISHIIRDGYVVANTQKINDVSIAEEELLEAAETREALGDHTPWRNAARSGGSATNEGGGGPSVLGEQAADWPGRGLAAADLDTMMTRDLLRLGGGFVRRMREGSAGWLTPRMLAIYGECPEDDPARFPWWFASVLPVSDLAKFRLLGTVTVRERLKICCRWILEWEESRW